VTGGRPSRHRLSLLVQAPLTWLRLRPEAARSLSPAARLDPARGSDPAPESPNGPSAWRGRGRRRP
jgi:hypothetical protein